MRANGKRGLRAGAGLVLAFILWTVLILSVDVRPVWVNGTNIGFAAVNVWFHRLTGVHLWIYTVTDWLGLVPVIICVCFGVLGLVQLIRRRSLKQVDGDILLLGGYYILVILGYLIFEMIPINYRPILIDGFQEASYPSSTTLLVLSVMPTLVFQVNRRTESATVRRTAARNAEPLQKMPLCGNRNRQKALFHDLRHAFHTPVSQIARYVSASIGTNFTRSPAESRESVSASNSRIGVRPMRFQPPGEASG